MSSKVHNNSKAADVVVQPVKSIQVILYSCPNCGDEVEEVKLCNSCKAHMRVIQVKELFGTDAEQFLRELGNQGYSSIVTTNSKIDDLNKAVDVENGIAEDHELDSLDIASKTESPDAVSEFDEIAIDDESLGDIFPDADDSDSKVKFNNSDGSTDWLDALDETDNDAADMANLNEFSDFESAPEL